MKTLISCHLYDKNSYQSSGSELNKIELLIETIDMSQLKIKVLAQILTVMSNHKSTQRTVGQINRTNEWPWPLEIIYLWQHNQESFV